MDEFSSQSQGKIQPSHYLWTNVREWCEWAIPFPVRYFSIPTAILPKLCNFSFQKYTFILRNGPFLGLSIKRTKPFSPQGFLYTWCKVIYSSVVCTIYSRQPLFNPKLQVHSTSWLYWEMVAVWVTLVMQKLPWFVCLSAVYLSVCLSLSYWYRISPWKLCFQKVFTAPDLFHILLCYSLNLKWITSDILWHWPTHTIPHNVKVEFRNVYKLITNGKLKCLE